MCAGIRSLTFVMEVYAGEQDNRERGSYGSSVSVLLIMLGVGVGGLIFVIPAFIALEAMILSSLPVFVFRSLDGSYANDFKDYQQIFAWLREDEEEFEARVIYFNSYHAELRLICEKKTAVKETRQAKAYLSSIVKGPSHKHKRRWSLLQAFQSFVHRIWDVYLTSREEGQPVFGIGVVYVWFCCVPVLVASSTYSLIYPILCFATTPWEHLGLLQRLFSLVYFVLLGVLVLLVPFVYQTYRSMWSVKLFHFSPSLNTLTQIKLEYNTKKNQHLYGVVGRAMMLIANASANKNSELVNHFVAVLPQIEKFAEFSSCIPLDVDQFLVSPIFRKLACEELTPLLGQV